MTRGWLVAVVAGFVLWAAPAHAELVGVGAHAGEVSGVADRDPYVGRVSGYRPSFFMVGDSITYAGTASLRARRVTWEVSAVPGRNLSTAPYYVADRVANPSRLATLVVALGTNADVPVDEAVGFYRRVAAMVPASTRVVFVTTWRSASWNTVADFRRQAWVQSRYSAAMRTVAAERAHTCVVEWRDTVKPRPSWLRDGVHPSSQGYVYGWAPMVQRGVLGCS